MKIATIFIACLVMACNSNVTKSEKDSLAAGSGDKVLTESGTVELPPPYKTESVINLSKVIGWENNATPVAPAGFKVTKYAGDMDNPRLIYVLPNKDVLIVESHKGRISLFRDTNEDGTPDLQTVFLSDLNNPFGMLLLNSYFYVCNENAVMRYAYTEGVTKISSGGQKILDLPVGGRHWTRNLIANQSGTKIYVAIGSGSDHAEKGIDYENRRACILEINPDGTGERLYASGLRNPAGMDWAPGTNTLWTAVNERDQLGDDLVPDFLTSVKENGFYGWPYSYFGQHEDPRINDADKRPDLVKKAIVPDVPLGSHTASLGLAFYTGKAFPQKYQNGAFIGQHGSWNRSVLSGYKVVFVPFVNGKPGQPEDFLTGFIADESKSKVYGRPVGVTMLPDGSLLVADDGGNVVWRVSYGK
ncbi:MAG: sorbosone dehydrogenase family protein [Bacteroidota bacterium]|nr:sorbosone dehydrogenase family protein [Bacteroidota bacterium]